MKDQIDLAIIGSGPAGYTAAIYASRAGLETHLWTGLRKGGQLMTTQSVENWPGAEAGMTGPQLMARMEEQARSFGVSFHEGEVEGLEVDADGFWIRDWSGQAYHARASVVATGSEARYLGLASEQSHLNRGVSACATCDGFLYRDERVAVVGGGNTAVEEALTLADLAAHVTMIHRGSKLRAEEILIKRLMLQVDQKKVEILWNHEVEEVLGDGHAVTGLKLMDRITASKSQIEIAALFVAIGHKPTTELMAHLPIFDSEGRLMLGHDGFAQQSAIPGLFIAGDVSGGAFRQAVTAAAAGCRAALEVKHYLSRHL